jgi:hypothetical protein
VVILFLGMGLPLSFFGISIPLADALAYVPILMLVGALPCWAVSLTLIQVILVPVFLAFARRLFQRAQQLRAAPALAIATSIK